MRRRGRILTATAAGLLALAGPAVALDLDAPAPASSLDLLSPSPGDASATAAAAADGNPLWSIPLDTLSATRERPLFSPSRRPPPRPDAEAAPSDAAAPEAGDGASAAPNLKLLGTIVGPDDGFGIFMDQGTNAVLRLRTGEAREGWVLRAVNARHVVMQNGAATVSLALPAREMDPEPAPEGDGARE